MNILKAIVAAVARAARFSGSHEDGRRAGSFALLQRLEPRVLLSDFRWVGGNNFDAWETPVNWKDPVTGDLKTVAPNGIDDNVLIDGNAQIGVHSSPTIFNLTVKGDANVSLVLDNGTSLTVAPHVDGQGKKTGGEIKIEQQANKTTALSLVTQEGTGFHAHVGADFIDSVGNVGGSSSLTVSKRTTLDVTGNIFSNHNKFDVTFHGEANAASMSLSGKDLPATGNPAVSQFVVDGTTVVTGRLVLGGNGMVNGAVNAGGALTTGDFYLPNRSVFTARGGANVTITGTVRVGDPFGAIALAAGVVNGFGAQFKVVSGAHVAASAGHATFSVRGGENGDASKAGFTPNAGYAPNLYVRSGGVLEVWNLECSYGADGKHGTSTLVEGEGSTIEVKGDMELGFLGGVIRDYEAGRMMIRSKGSVLVDGKFKSWSVVDETYDLLTIESDANLEVMGTAEVGGFLPGAIGPYPVYARALIRGDATHLATQMIVHGDMKIGNATTWFFGARYATTVHFQVDTGGLLDCRSATPIRKSVSANMAGDGTVRDAAHPGGVKASAPGADFIPGDYFAVDAYGQIVPGASLVEYDENEDVISSPYYEHDVDGNIIYEGDGSPILDENGAPVLDEDGSPTYNGGVVPILSDHASDPLGTLTIDGDLDASAGFTLDSVLDPSESSNKLVVSGTATFGQDLLGQIRAFSTQGTNSFDHGYSWTILTAGTIEGEFTIPAFLSYGASDEVPYVWGSPIPAAIAAADLPAVAPGLVWELRKVHTDAGTASTDSLVLAVVDPTPNIVSVNATGCAPSGVEQTCVIAFTADGGSLDWTSGTPFVVQAEGRTDLQNGGGLVLPTSGATVGNWNTVHNVNFSSGPGTDGYWTGTLTFQVGSEYRLRVVADAVDGGQYVSAGYNFSTSMPTRSPIDFAVETVEGSSLPQITFNGDVWINGYFARTSGAVFGDQWCDLQWFFGDYAAMSLYQNGAGAETQFLVHWMENGGTNSGYDWVSPNVPSGLTSFGTAEGNANYTIRGYENWCGTSNSTIGPMEYAGRNGTQSAWAWQIPIIPYSGFFNHAAVLTDGAYLTATGATGVYTKFSAVRYDTSHVMAPVDLRMGVMADATGDTVAGVKLSWRDESDNEAGFLVERGILPVGTTDVNSTNVAWTTLDTVAGTAYEDTDWGAMSGYAVAYRVMAVSPDNSSVSAAVVTSPIMWERYIYTPQSQYVTVAGRNLMTVDDGVNCVQYDMAYTQMVVLNCPDGTTVELGADEEGVPGNGTLTAAGPLQFIGLQPEPGSVTMSALGLTLNVNCDMTFAMDPAAYVPMLTISGARGENWGVNLTFEAGDSGGVLSAGGTLILSTTTYEQIRADIYSGNDCQGIVYATGAGVVELAGASVAIENLVVNNGTLFVNNRGPSALNEECWDAILSVTGNGTFWVGQQSVHSLYVDSFNMPEGTVVVDGSVWSAGNSIFGGLVLGYGPGVGLFWQNRTMIVQANDSMSAQTTMLNLTAAYWDDGTINDCGLIYDFGHHYNLAVVVNGDLGTPFSYFAGATVNSYSVLVTTALRGDLNLDGHVDQTDLAILNAHEYDAARTWVTGNVTNLGFDADWAALQANWTG